MNEERPELTSLRNTRKPVSRLAEAAANQAFRSGAVPSVALHAAKEATTRKEARRLTYTPHMGARERERAKKFAKEPVTV